jgi:hypothetical protein
MKNIVKLNPQYRANVIAQAACFIINCLIYTITSNPLYIWICISTITFIGIISSQPKGKFWDNNLAHHMLFIILFYFLSAISIKFPASYLILIVIFTYIFYILKDSGYDKSLTLWTLVQAIMFLSSTNQLSFSYKFLGTTLAFFEAQIAIFICFYLFPSNIEYIAEPRVLDIKKIPLREWINPKYEKVRLALRGTLVAGILYLICISYVSDDARPNWAVITALSALLRNDDEGGWHTIISGIIGSIFGFTMAFIVIKLDMYAPALIPFILWISLLTALILMFEYTISKTYLTQILGISFTIVATISSYAVLDLNSKFFLHLRLINNILGITFAFIALTIWIISKKLFPVNKT